MSRLDGFPHVDGIATRANRNKLLRLVEELQTMICTREEVFRSHGIDSMNALRARHREGRVPELVSADIVVLVDGLAAMRTEFEELLDSFTELLRKGGSYGIHIVLALTRWNELPLASQSLIGQRFEMRLNDPADSTIGKAASETLRSAKPGRVLTENSLYAQIALPVLDHVGDDAVPDALTALAKRTRASWTGPAASPIRLLPDNFDPTELPNAITEPRTVPFGLRQDTMQAVSFEPLTDQHMIVYGDTQCGKTTLLRGLAQGFINRATPDDLVIAVMDSRSGLVSAIPEPYLGGHAANGRDASALATAIAEELENRSGTGTRDISPRIVILVDDYDIIASAGMTPLAPLLPYLPSSRDLAVNLIVTRPVAGASRAMFDSALQSIRDVGGTGLVMSGERSEGQIFPKVYAEQLPAGRGRLVRRGTLPRLVQVANFGLGHSASEPSPQDTTQLAAIQGNTVPDPSVIGFTGNLMS